MQRLKSSDVGRVLAASVAVFGVVGCDEDRLEDAYYGRMVYEVFPDTAQGVSLDPSDPNAPRAFNLATVYADGNLYEYLDLGEVNPLVPKVYFLERDGRPVPGQHPIIDVAPDKAEYSPFWQVVKVEVDADYRSNDAKSVSSIEAHGWVVREQPYAIFCAVVNPDAFWFTSDAELPPLSIFYGTNEPVPNLLYDPEGEGLEALPVLGDNDAEDYENALGDVLGEFPVVELQPVWHKRLLGFCYGGDSTEKRNRQYRLVDFEDPTTKSKVKRLDSGPEANLGRRYAQVQLVDAETGETAEWGNTPILSSGPADPDYTAARVLYEIVTETSDPLISEADFDVEQAYSLDVVVAQPIIRRVPPPPEPAPEGEVMQ
jgi:hypothetical protein